MAMVAWLNRHILFISVYLSTLLINIRAAQPCTKDVISIDCAKLLGNVMYVEYGRSFNLYCATEELQIQPRSGSLSDDLYFTLDNQVLSNDLIEIINSTAIKLHVETPPKSEAIYVCRLKDNNQPIDWTAVVVGDKPQSVTGFDCLSYNRDNFICTWTRPETEIETTYDVAFATSDESNQFTTNKCTNLIYHKDSRKMSCLWTHNIYSQSNKPGQLYVQLTMTNDLGATKINKLASQQFESVVPPGSLQDFLCESGRLIPAPTTHPHLTIEPSLVDQDYPYKVVCFVYEGLEIGKFFPKDIDPSLCSHIVVDTAELDENQLTLKPNIEPELYRQITDFRTKGVKVSLGFIGWTASGDPKYSRLINDPVARKHFIINAVDFLEKNNFDGLDLMWFYPKCWQNACTKGPDSDKPAFAEFVKELRDAFSTKGLLLSATISQWKLHLDSGYDLPTHSRYLDWITVLAHRYHTEGDGYTGHTAPLYIRDEDKNPQINIDFSVNYLIQQGVNRRKILLTIPGIGQLYTLSDGRQNGLYAPTVGGSVIQYHEFCKLITKAWTVVQDPRKRIGPYAYFDNQWISFDDETMVRYKSQYIKSMGLGGVTLWSIGFDDFNGVCGCGRYPLLKAANRVLRSYAEPTCQLPAV